MLSFEHKYTKQDYKKFMFKMFGSLIIWIGYLLLADLGKAMGCSTNNFVINYLTNWLSNWPFVKISLRRRHALMVEDGAFSHK